MPDERTKEATGKATFQDLVVLWDGVWQWCMDTLNKDRPKGYEVEIIRCFLRDNGVKKDLADKKEITQTLIELEGLDFPIEE